MSSFEKRRCRRQRWWCRRFFFKGKKKENLLPTLKKREKKKRKKEERAVHLQREYAKAFFAWAIRFFQSSSVLPKLKEPEKKTPLNFVPKVM